MFENSILVVAHPDDEILWFSSIIDKVQTILFCFIHLQTRPQLRANREKSLSEYPLKNITCLGMDEAYADADWEAPIMTRFGIDIVDKVSSEQRYIRNYYELKDILTKKLANYDTIFTHNPWGEYGSEEHVQVYRVIKEIQKKFHYNLWFSNFCSNKSTNLMTQLISEAPCNLVKLGTNRSLSMAIKEIYFKNGCWTWYRDWRLSDEETFILDSTAKVDANSKGDGFVFPINYIKIKHFRESSRNRVDGKKRSRCGRFMQKLKESLLMQLERFYDTEPK